MFANKAFLPVSYRDSVQAPDRKTALTGIVSDLAEKLPPSQILVDPPTHISKSGEETIILKSGATQTAGFVRIVMLRLELLKTISGETYAALRDSFVNGTQLSDWHAINSEAFGLGTTRDSESFAEAKRGALQEAFWRGFTSVFTFGATIRDGAREVRGNRLEFLPSVGIEDIFLSALTPQGTLGNPEKT